MAPNKLCVVLDNKVAMLVVLASYAVIFDGIVHLEQHSNDHELETKVNQDSFAVFASFENYLFGLRLLTSNCVEVFDCVHRIKIGNVNITTMPVKSMPLHEN